MKAIEKGSETEGSDFTADQVDWHGAGPKSLTASPGSAVSHFQDKVADILANAERYHLAYYQADTFRGPSLYFHHRALQTRNSEDFLAHLEYVYATLASWGMHRMGRGGSKMVGSTASGKVSSP
jgi:hypothetical protein